MKNIYLYFLKIFLIFFLGVVFSIYLSSLFIERVYLNSSKKALKNFTVNTTKYLERIDEDKTFQILSLLSQINSYRITLIKEDGQVIYDSHNNPKTMENHKNREEVQRALKEGEAEVVRFSNTLNTRLLYYAKKISYDKDIYILRVSAEISELSHFIKPYRKTFLLLLSSLFLIILFFVFQNLKNFAKNMDKIQDSLSQISKGNFIEELKIDKKNILYPLAQQIEYLSDSLRDLTEDIKSQKEFLSNIIENLPFPVVIAKEDKLFFIANKPFREIFRNFKNLDEIANILRNEYFYSALKSFYERKENFNIEIEYEGKFFSVSGNKIDHQKSQFLLLSFVDITEVKRVERMQADFTANVSHELKTPITVLKGYIDTLEEEIDENKKRIVNILKKHIDRLSALVSDVLLLSRLDSRISIEREFFSFKEIIVNALEMFTNDISEKQLEIKLDIGEDVTYFGDSFLIFQALINLISNAIKFTPVSGKIYISVKKEEKNIIFTIEDTGIGIPKNFQDRIFERFFIVDKSRSRQLGGTGLGLAIVKNIIELHNGFIELESSPGKKTKFIITLPVKQ
ncbi:MAG: ATP-binding protein [Proteobacteria bacterium]|nr:ATP-binding protein [Pseudomonadota bacterium]